MSGVGFLATMKTFAPSIRRRRRIEKQNLELHNNHNNNNNNGGGGNNSTGCNHGGGSGGSTPGSGAGTPGTNNAGISSTASTPTGPSAASGILGGVGEVISPGWDIVPPITPPAAFLPPGYKRLSMKGKPPAREILPSSPPVHSCSLLIILSTKALFSFFVSLPFMICHFVAIASLPVHLTILLTIDHNHQHQKHRRRFILSPPTHRHLFARVG